MRKTVSFWIFIIVALAFPLSSCSDDGLNEEIGLSTSPINDLDDDGTDDATMNNCSKNHLFSFFFYTKKKLLLPKMRERDNRSST